MQHAAFANELNPQRAVHSLQFPGGNAIPFPQPWKTRGPGYRAVSPLPAHLGAPGAFQHLLGERDDVRTTGVHLLYEEPLHRLTESRLRIWCPSRHHLNQRTPQPGQRRVAGAKRRQGGRKRGGVSSTVGKGRDACVQRRLTSANF